MKNRNKSLNIEKIKEIFTGLNKVFKAMQKENIIHRDIKLKNLLVKYIDENNKDKFIVKLGDYGIGKFLNNGNSISGLKGTNQTVAPEIILQKIEKYESSVDIFSLGIVLYQLSHHLNHPFNNNDSKRIITYYNYYDEDNFNIEFDKSINNKDFKDLLGKMLKLKPENRLTWNQYFNHPFFQ